MDNYSILLALWAFLPAGLANMAPVFANKIPHLNRWTTPLDLRRSYKGTRMLGDNKTWRGLFFGVFIGGLVGLAQYLIFPDFTIFASPSAKIMAAAGILLGAGALLGDAVESLFKRQKKLEPGKSWFPFDQLDYIIGALILWAPLAKRPTLANVAVIVVFYFSMHILVSFLGYLTGFKEKPI
jgi:CDP-2,3-bis-(O-geranylgeranyl)-sn-glycerol synthase